MKKYTIEDSRQFLNQMSDDDDAVDIEPYFRAAVIFAESAQDALERINHIDTSVSWKVRLSDDDLSDDAQNQF